MSRGLSRVGGRPAFVFGRGVAVRRLRPGTRSRTVLAGASAALLAGAAEAAEPSYLQELVVTAQQGRARGLTTSAAAATGLDLSILKTPASAEVVDLADQVLRGPRTVAEATRGVTGLTFTTRAGAPGVFQSRGFTENALVTLYDGLRVQSATISARAYDPFNFERIEVLRGPASVVHGEGATAGVVNYVRRKPRLGPLTTEILAEAGEQDRQRLGIAVTGGLSESLAAVGSAVWQHSGSFIEDTDSKGLHVVGGVGGRLGDRGGFLIEGDHLRSRVDDAYWGAPLVGGALDSRVKRRNYNRSPDNRMADDVTWLRSAFTYEFGPSLDYRGQFYVYDADRDWRNFYAFAYIAGPPEQVEARNVESLAYDHRLWGARHDLKIRADLGGVRSVTVFAADYSDTDFSSPRRDGAPSNGQPRPRFDLASPQPAPFVQGPRLRQREADVRQFGASGEQRLDFGRLELVGGVRLARIEATLARPEANPPTPAFDANFSPVDYRAAATFELAPGQVLYAAASSGAEPVESLLLLPVTQADFKLSRSTGFEAGYKADFGAGQVTLALFDLKKTRLPSLDPADPNLRPQIGEQHARGVEASAAYAVGPLRLSANLALTDAEYRRYNDFGAARDEVRPANVPKVVANASAAWRVTERLELGGFVQHVGERPSNNANLQFLPDYTTLDLYGRVSLGERATLTIRAINVTDETYVEWATQSFGQNNLYFGSPRRLEASLQVRF